MFARSSKEELLKVPRIAIIHGDPGWARFMEPIKDAFEIPPTFFQDIHVDAIQADFFDKKAQYMLCIVCPNSSNWGGVDLGTFALQWHEYLGQGSALLVFGTDVDWLGALGNRFHVKGIVNPSTTVSSYDVDETGVALNAMVLEGLDALGPYLGEYTDLSTAWKRVATSTSGHPTIVTQLFGNAQITLCTGTMKHGNAIKIFPVKMLLWGIQNSMLAEKSDSTLNVDEKWAISIMISSRVLSAGYPVYIEASIDSFHASGLDARSISLEHAMVSANGQPVKTGTVTREITANGRGIFIKLDLDVHGIPDGLYVLRARVKGEAMNHACEFPVEIKTSQIKQLVSHVAEIHARAKDELDRIANTSKQDKNKQDTVDTELARRLVYLVQRIECFHETVDNMIIGHPRWDVIPHAGTASMPGLSVFFHSMTEVQQFYDEIVARSIDLPDFAIPSVWNYGNTQIQQFYSYLARIASDTRCEIQWEVTGGFSIGNLLQFKKNPEKGCLLSMYNNGIPTLSATYTIRSRAGAAALKDRLEKEAVNPGSSVELVKYEARASMFKEKNALAIFTRGCKHGFTVASGRILVDALEIVLTTTSIDALKVIVRRLLDGDAIDLEAANALARIDLDIHSADLGLLAEVDGDALDNRYEEIMASVTTELEHDLVTWHVADFHSHTTASDGVFRPQDVAVFAACAGIDVYGLSDHHSIAASTFLAKHAKEKQWKMAIIPGCQEVTHIYFHAVSLGARASVIESVPVEQVPAEAQKVDACMNYSHSRLPHPWPQEQLALGKASRFDSFDLSDRILQGNRDTWLKEGRIPVFTNSTGTDTGDFGRQARTIFFVSAKDSSASTFFEDLPRHLVDSMRGNECVAMAGSMLVGKLKNVARVQAIVRATGGPIKAHYERTKLARFISLIAR